MTHANTILIAKRARNFLVALAIGALASGSSTFAQQPRGPIKPIDATGVLSGQVRPTPAHVPSAVDGGPVDELARHPDDRGVRTAQLTDREPFILPPGGGNPVDRPVQVPVILGDQFDSGQFLAPEDEAYYSGISPYKKGFFQKLSFSYAYLPESDGDDFAVQETNAFVTFALPAPSVESPLLLTFGFDAYFLEGPATPDLPGNLYGSFAQAMWVPRINDRLQLILALQPGFYGDYESGDEDLFRLEGQALFKWEPFRDKLQVVGGVLYLDRYDLKWLPAGGVIWTPTDNWQFDVLFPIPKASWRVYATPESEWWVFVGGEFGNETFAFERSDGALDQLSLKDLRVTAGVEMKRDGGAGLRLEGGYVFEREIDFRELTPDIELGDTYIVRAVLQF